MAALRGSKWSYFIINFFNNFAMPKTNFHKCRQRLFHCSSLFFNPEDIKMPSLSPTMSEGKIIKWLKKEGDNIKPGDVLCDIETDKAVVSMEMEEEGILAKILVHENSQSIKVGSSIAIMVSPEEDWKNVEIPMEVVGSSSDSSDVPGGSRDQESVISGPSARPIKMPSLSPTMTSGTIIKWLKKEGDILVPGDGLCEIQTDKAVMTMEVEEEGILAKIVVPDDTKDVEINTLIGLIVSEGEDWKSVVVTSKPPAGKKEVANKTARMAGKADEIRQKSFGPAVRALLSMYNLEPGLIKATGKDNRLLKEDVIKHIQENNLKKKVPKVVSPPTGQAHSIQSLASSTKKSITSPTSVSKYKDIELSNMRLTIAKRLVESKQQIPHSYSVAKCDVDDLIKIKEAFSTEGIKVSINDLLIKILGLTLQMMPKANALFINNEVKLSQNVDICVGVATDAGLYTPVVKSANHKSVVKISEEVKNLIEKAKMGKLKPEEFQGGTFTISNLGMFGISQFKAIVNPPQSGILAIGGIIQSLSPDLEIKKQIIVSLSYDRRVFEEQEAAEFLQIFKYFTENPKLITLGVNQSIAMRA